MQHSDPIFALFFYLILIVGSMYALRLSFKFLVQTVFDLLVLIPIKSVESASILTRHFCLLIEKVWEKNENKINKLKSQEERKPKEQIKPAPKESAIDLSTPAYIRAGIKIESILNGTSFTSSVKVIPVEQPVTNDKPNNFFEVKNRQKLRKELLASKKKESERMTMIRGHNFRTK